MVLLASSGPVNQRGVQAIVPKAPVERLDVRILNRTTRPDEVDAEHDRPLG
jgi:hypothetical protein